MSSVGGTTLLSGELSLDGIAPSLFGLIHPKNVGSQPQRAVSTRGGKRGGAREHCSQKEMDKTILGRRILVQSTALEAILRKGYSLHLCK